jgi:hypothetical protein
MDRIQEGTHHRIFGALQGAIDASDTIAEGLEAAMGIAAYAAGERPRLMEAIARAEAVRSELKNTSRDLVQLIADHGENRVPELARQVEHVLLKMATAVRVMGDLLEAAEIA